MYYGYDLEQLEPMGHGNRAIIVIFISVLANKPLSYKLKLMPLPRSYGTVVARSGKDIKILLENLSKIIVH